MDSNSKNDKADSKDPWSEKEAKFKEKTKRLKALRAYREYTEELKKAEKEAMSKSFEDLFRDVFDPIKVYIPELGCNITYAHIPEETLQKLVEIKDEEKRGNEILYAMWSAGDKTVTREKFDKLPRALKDAVSRGIMRKSPFLMWKGSGKALEKILDTDQLISSLDIDLNTNSKKSSSSHTIK